jgi:RimJ/RimL family protein N-acetyltransferase
MEIDVNDQVHLSEFRSSDKPALIQYLNDPDIYDRTLRIPFPYTDVSADEWLALVATITQQQARPVHFAIRNAADALIGGCGFDGFQVGTSHRAEVGYWLARPFWSRGLMTAVVQRACRHAFEEFGLVKITAHVFSHNTASARVLEKCGFHEEGFLRKHFLKDGQFLDARLFLIAKAGIQRLTVATCTAAPPVHPPEVLPKSPVGEAIGYALNNWAALARYTEAGFLAIGRVAGWWCVTNEAGHTSRGCISWRPASFVPDVCTMADSGVRVGNPSIRLPRVLKLRCSVEILYRAAARSMRSWVSTRR